MADRIDYLLDNLDIPNSTEFKSMAAGLREIATMTFRDRVAQAIHDAQCDCGDLDHGYYKQYYATADATIAVMVAKINEARRAHNSKCPPYCCADVLAAELKAEIKP